MPAPRVQAAFGKRCARGVGHTASRAGVGRSIAAVSRPRRVPPSTSAPEPVAEPVAEPVQDDKGRGKPEKFADQDARATLF